MRRLLLSFLALFVICLLCLGFTMAPLALAGNIGPPVLYLDSQMWTTPMAPNSHTGELPFLPTPTSMAGNCDVLCLYGDAGVLFLSANAARLTTCGYLAAAGREPTCTVAMNLYKDEVSYDIKLPVNAYGIVFYDIGIDKTVARTNVHHT